MPNKRERKSKINALILGLLLIGLMVFSTVGFAFSGRSDNSTEKSVIEYNNIEFIKEGDYWRSNIQGQEFYTMYNPEEVRDINFLNFLTLQNYIQKPLYIVGDYPEPSSEVLRNLDSFILRFNQACLEEENCLEDFPIKNCLKDNIIVFEEIKSGEGERALQEENCFFIKSSLANQTRYVDAYLFDLLGLR